MKTASHGWLPWQEPAPASPAQPFRNFLSRRSANSGLGVTAPQTWRVLREPVLKYDSGWLMILVIPWSLVQIQPGPPFNGRCPPPALQPSP